MPILEPEAAKQAGPTPRTSKPSSISRSSHRCVDWVDPFIGTEAVDLPEPEGLAATWFYLKAQIGNTHPGACLPFSAVSACPYSGAYLTGYGVYDANYHGSPPKIYDTKGAFGVTHVHHSGTGYISRFYNYFLTVPFNGGPPAAPEVDLEKSRPYRLLNEHASPGYYAGRLEQCDVNFELTAGERSAAHRYEFDGSDNGSNGPAGIVVDVTNEGLARKREQSRPTVVSVCLDDDGTCRGRVVHHNIPWFFAIICRGARVASSLWRGARGGAKADHGMPPVRKVPVSSIDGLSEAECVFERAGVVYETREEKKIELYVGLSLASEEAAVEAARAAATLGFDALRARAEEIWEQHLGRLRVEGGDRRSRRMFYTALYHSLLKPVQTESANFLWKDGPPLYADFATMWDQYKTHHPLVLTLCPERIGPVVQSLQRTAQAVGFLPPALIFHDDFNRFSNQSRSLCHVILWDAYQHWQAAGTPVDQAERNSLWRLHSAGKVDWNGVLDAMIESLERDAASLSPGARQHYSHLLDIGYGAFCTVRLAEELGRDDIVRRAETYLEVWKTAFDPDTKLMREADYYEAGHVSYSFRLMHDMAARIAFCGGRGAFLAQADSFFGYGALPVEQLRDPPWDEARERGLALGRFDGVNNEVTLETPYAYHYAGEPDKTAEVVAGVMDYHFSDTPGGLPGNDDSGALSSWYVWNAAGLFPVPGQGLFFVGSPLFDAVQFNIGGHRFDIQVNRSSRSAIYLAAVRLNGEALDRTFLTYREVHQGGLLKISLTDRPGTFVPTELPPSYP